MQMALVWHILCRVSDLLSLATDAEVWIPVVDLRKGRQVIFSSEWLQVYVGRLVPCGSTLGGVEQDRLFVGRRLADLEILLECIDA